MADETQIRPFVVNDLIWLKPIALKFGEWEDIRDAVFNRTKERIALSIWVVEGKAMVALFEEVNQPGKTFVCGLTDKRGMKELFTLGRWICRVSMGFGLTLHSPELDEGSWQIRFFEKMGFQSTDGLNFVLPAVEG